MAFECISFLSVSLCSSEDSTSEPMKHIYSDYINPVLVTYVWKEFFPYFYLLIFLSNKPVKLSKHLINQLILLFIKEKHLAELSGLFLNSMQKV